MNTYENNGFTAGATPPPGSVPPGYQPPGQNPYGQPPYGTMPPGQMPGHQTPEGTNKFFTEIRRLGWKRSQKGWLGGIAQAISKNFDWDVYLVRGVLIIFLLLAFPVAVLCYVTAWALIPEENTNKIQLEELLESRFTGSQAIILLGAFAALTTKAFRFDLRFISPAFDNIAFFISPLTLAALVIGLVIFFVHRSKENEHIQTGAMPTVNTGANFQFPSTPAAGQGPAAANTTATGANMPAAYSAGANYGGTNAGGTQADGVNPLSPQGPVETPPAGEAPTTEVPISKAPTAEIPTEEAPIGEVPVDQPQPETFTRENTTIGEDTNPAPSGRNETFQMPTYPQPPVPGQLPLVRPDMAAQRLQGPVVFPQPPAQPPLYHPDMIEYPEGRWGKGPGLAAFTGLLGVNLLWIMLMFIGRELGSINFNTALFMLGLSGMGFLTMGVVLGYLAIRGRKGTWLTGLSIAALCILPILLGLISVNYNSIY